MTRHAYLPPSDERGVETPPRGVIAGAYVLPRDVARYCHDAGWRDLKVIVAVCVAGAESSLYSGAYHDNEDGSRDRGVFQLNSSHAWITDADAYDPPRAAVAAYQLYKSAGYSFRPWVAYTSGAYLAWGDAAIRGFANMARRMWEPPLPPV